jgi:hypothetical protein
VRLHLAILRLAALFVPHEQRVEWSAEWRAELWYLCQARKPATAFCLGAFKDAPWLRRNSPPTPAILRLESPVLCLEVVLINVDIALAGALHVSR